MRLTIQSVCFSVAILLASACSAAKMPKLIVWISDSNPSPGHVFLSEGRDWDWMFSSTGHIDNWWGKQTPYYYARQTGGMLLAHPGGRHNPMSLDQFVLTTQQAVADPNNKQLQVSADWDQFITAASRYKRKNRLWLGIYVGSLNLSLYPFMNETPEQLATRAEAALAPILCIQPHIDWLGFDYVSGSPYDPADPRYSVVGGQHGAMAILIRRIQKLGIQVAVEPSIRKDACWLLSPRFPVGTITNDIFRNRFLGDTEWHRRDRHRKRVALMTPTDLPVTPILSDRTTWKKSNDEKLAATREANKAGYAMTYAFSWFPDVTGTEFERHRK